MNRMEELLARSLDEPLSSEEQQALDSALSTSAELRQMKAELEMIGQMASGEPSPCGSGVFLRLQDQVDAVYAKPRSSWFFLPMRLAGFATLVVFGVVFFMLRQPVVQSDHVQDIDAMQKSVAVAQQQFHEAVTQMENAAIGRLGAMPAQLAVVYAHNLHELNRAIAQCEQLLQKNQDPMVYGHLSRAYAAKVDLLESLLAI